MNITKENINELNAIIRLKIGKEDYQPRIEKVLGEYRKKAVIKGFRPGKVPMGIVNKMYGASAKMEEIDKLVSESLSKYITDEKINFLGQPLPSKEQKHIDLDKDEEFEFSFDIGLAPEVKITANKDIKIPYYTIKIEDELIEKQIEQHRNQFGKSEQSELITPKSYIRGDIQQVDENQNVLPDGIQSPATYLTIELIKDEEIKKRFIGACKSQIINFDVKKAYVNETEISSMLKIDKSLVADMNPNFQVVVNEINDFSPAEINTELFDKIYGVDEITTEEEYRTKIKSELALAFTENSDYRFGVDCSEIITENAKLAFPEEFLKRWLMATNKDQKLTEEIMEKEFPAFLVGVSWQIIKDKFGKDIDIKMTKEELLEQAKKDTLSQFKQYGLPANALPDERIEEFALKTLEREEDSKKIFDKVYESKILKHIKENVTLEQKEITFEELKKLFEK